MGLDITAYSKISFVRKPVSEDDEPDWKANELQIWGNLRGFESRFTGDTGIYSYEECYGFCAGPYSGYNEWRECLAKLAGYEAVEYTNQWEGTRMLHAAGAWNASGGPFHELIHFADNEGAIGAEVSAKLHRDFVEWRDRARAFAETLGILTGGYFMESYDEWTSAFALASDGGAVKFH